MDTSNVTTQNISYIYGLFDPRTMELRYIGKSRRPRYRYTSHIKEECTTRKCNWIKQLASEGLTPSMEILEECLLDDINDAERAWIADARTHGLDLCNMTDGGDGNSEGSFKQGNIPWNKGMTFDEDYAYQRTEFHSEKYIGQRSISRRMYYAYTSGNMAELYKLQSIHKGLTGKFNSNYPRGSGGKRSII